MKLSRFDYDPGSALGFYEESLTALGALCERTWHDRLEVVAEGRAAKLWNDEGNLHSQELLFAAANTIAARDAGSEVFPGCPLTFRLFELLRPAPLSLEKVVLARVNPDRLPDLMVLEKLWRSQFPASRKWRLAAELKPAFHFSLVAAVRAEMQTIDQHWSLHRLAVALPGGETDDSLAADIPLLGVDTQGEVPAWPVAEPQRWWSLLRDALELEIRPDLEAMQKRQEQYLAREIQRIDDYFASYEQELARRGARGGAAGGAKSGERLAAARAEHARRRLDQVARHEIRVQLHLDALLLVAEHCWRGELEVEEERTLQSVAATFVPRTRRWFREIPEGQVTKGHVRPTHGSTGRRK